MDTAIKNALSFLAKMVYHTTVCPGVKKNSKLRRMMNGDFSAFGAAEPECMTAWEPAVTPDVGTCGTCRYLDTKVCYPTYPAKYRCIKSGSLHYECDKCDIPAFGDMGGNGE